MSPCSSCPFITWHVDPELSTKIPGVGSLGFFKAVYWIPPEHRVVAPNSDHDPPPSRLYLKWQWIVESAHGMAYSRYVVDAQG